MIVTVVFHCTAAVCMWLIQSVAWTCKWRRSAWSGVLKRNWIHSSYLISTQVDCQKRLMYVLEIFIRHIWMSCTSLVQNTLVSLNSLYQICMNVLSRVILWYIALKHLSSCVPNFILTNHSTHLALFGFMVTELMSHTLTYMGAVWLKTKVTITYRVFRATLRVSQIHDNTEYVYATS
jgi:hypothetical protein